MDDIAQELVNHRYNSLSEGIYNTTFARSPHPFLFYTSSITLQRKWFYLNKIERTVFRPLVFGIIESVTTEVVNLGIVRNRFPFLPSSTSIFL